VKGREAILTIFEDGEEKEKVRLQEHDDKEELHSLFQEKGFQLRDGKTVEEHREAVKEKNAEKRRLTQEVRKKRADANQRAKEELRADAAEKAAAESALADATENVNPAQESVESGEEVPAAGESYGDTAEKETVHSEL
jgi:hypothetical protein